MRYVYQLLVISVLIISAALFCIYGAQAVKPKPQKQNLVKQPVIPMSQEEVAIYKRALNKYLAKIDKINAQSEKDSKIAFKKLIANYNQRDKDLISNESSILKELSKAKKIDFEGLCPANMYVIPTSAASARLFTALYKENKIDEEALTSRISYMPFLICHEWTPLLKEVAASVKKDSPLWRRCTSVLCAMDPLNSEHRSRIEQDFTVRKLNSAITLDHLLFKYDKSNGMRHALKVEKNTELAHKIIEIKELPEARVVAAEYLAEIGETKLAEDTCLEIMWQPYRCIGINRDEQSIETDNDKYDQKLYFARHRAMPFMLSKLKSERCFRVVYDRANMDWTDGQEKWKLPHGWKGISRYDTGGLEIDEAKAIISGLTGEDTCE